MRSRKILYSVIALVLIAVCILPGLAGRISWERSAKVYVAAIDAARLTSFFDDSQLPDVLRDYRDAGVTTVVFWEGKEGFHEKLMALARELGLSIALVPDVGRESNSELERIVQEYPVSYICLRPNSARPDEEVPEAIDRICRVVRENDLTLVLTENANQIGNAEVPGSETYLHAADGNILRAFVTYPRSSLIQGDYPVLYYQMYNSLVDRNTQFMWILQPDDEGYTPEECARRAQLSIRLFAQKAEREGYVSQGQVDHTAYQTNLRLVCGGAAALAVVLLLMMLELLLDKAPGWLTPAGLLTAAAAMTVTFVMPEALLSLYPTAFCMIAPSFGMTVCMVHLERNRKTRPLPLLLISTVGLALACMAISGGVAAAMLSGSDYFLNNLLFRGVKVTLLAPVAFACLVIAVRVLRSIAGVPLKTLLQDLVRKFRWYHAALVAALCAAAVVYLIRSGNVGTISFTELYMRNLLSDVFEARPRTKEFLVGWPCLVLYIYCVKADRMKLLQAILGLGTAVLFASCMNTFCHVFTMAQTMYLRLFYGFVLGAAISAAVLPVVHLSFRLTDRSARTGNE